MSDSLPPLSDDLARLFARANMEPEREVHLAKVRAGVTRAMILRGVPGFGPDAPRDVGVGSDGGGVGGVGGVTRIGAGALVTKAVAVKASALAAAAGLAIGLAAGYGWGVGRSAGTSSTTTASPSVTPSASTPASATSVARPMTIDDLPAAPAVDAGVASPSRPLVVSSAPSPVSEQEGPARRSALRRERELVDGAAGALRSGNPQLALDLSNQAARQFAEGQLGEEREVIAIESLLALGRRAEAAARLSRFRSEFPRSPAGSRLAAKISSGRDG